MPSFDVSAPDGKVYSVNAPEGATKEDAIRYVQENLYKPAAVSAGKSINSALGDIPRQIGLTVRYGLEGVGGLADVATEPVAGFMRMAGIPTKSTSQLATSISDAIGLPSPQGANERVIGDASRLMAGGGAGAAAARAGSALSGATGKVLTQLSANPLQQISAAAGAGLAGGASREGGGGTGAQIAASMLGGVAGGMAPGAIGGTVNAVKRAMTPSITPQQLDMQLTRVLAQSGGNFAELPDFAKNSLRTELRSSLQAGKEVNPEAVRRLADFATVRGTTPTRGMVTQDPVQITREMNLAKMGANSNDNQLQGLARIQNQNNQALIDTLNAQGAMRGNIDGAGELVNSSILGRQAQLRGAETQAWNEARNSPGYRQPIEKNVISDINQALGDEGLMPFMNPTISNYLSAFQSGQQPFTPQAYRNLQSMLSNEMSRGGNEAAAAGLARRVLERAELRPITNPGGIDFGLTPVTSQTAAQLRNLDAQPGQAIDAVNNARAATRAAYGYEDSSPLVRSVLSDGASGDPARIAKRFVIGGTPNEAQMLAQEVGEAGRGPIRDALLSHLKSKALNGAADEVGKFSQSAYNKALRDIGDAKLSLFFSPEEVAQLRSVGRVASYMQSQPVGSAVNNSNSGALVLGRGADMLGALASKIPGGGLLVADPLQSINISLSQRAAQNLTPGLLTPQPKKPVLSPLLLPSLAISGGLLAP